jgi:hypothetical protein
MLGPFPFCLFILVGTLLIMNMLDDGYKTDASDEDDTSK